MTVVEIWGLQEGLLLFISIVSEYVSELRQLTGLLFISRYI
jgi:hypothetical protein